MNNDISRAKMYIHPLIRTSLLVANDEIILQLQDRLTAKRFRPQEGENLRLQYIQTLLQAIQIKNEVIRDYYLDDILERLEALENGQLRNTANPEDINSLFDF